MRRLAVLGALAALFAGCGGGDDEAPWSGKPDGFEPDGDLATAKEQRVNASAQRHTLYPEPDVDWMRFRVTAPDVDIGDDLYPAHGLWLQTVHGAPSAQLWREDGLITSPDGGLFDTPGVYFVRVNEATGGAGEYSIWLTLYKEGDALPDVVATTVSVEPESAAATQTITARVANQGGAEALLVNCTAYVSADRTLGGDTEIGTAAEIASLPENSYIDVSIDADFSAVTPGPWYVLVEADAASAESDTTNNVAVGSTLVAVDTGDARDVGTPDDTIAAADGKGTLAPGGSIPDLTLYPAGDVDVIKLDIPDISYCYEIQTQNIRGDANTVIEVVDAADNPIDYADAGGQEDGGCYLWIDGGAAGLTDVTSYYVRVTSTDELAGAYDISLRAGPRLTPSGDEPVDYSSTLGYEPDDVFEPVIGVAAWRSIFPDGVAMTRAFFGDGSDVDYLVYAVSAADGGGARAITATGDGIDLQMTLLDHKGNTVSAGHVGATSNIWIVDVATPAGLYYLKIENLSATPGIYTVVVPTGFL
ncbi:MAG: CARDB domain-containing protein [Planctomycetota bacterium]|jgi:hypothetical protein